MRGVVGLVFLCCFVLGLVVGGFFPPQFESLPLFPLFSPVIEPFEPFVDKPLF